jgi:cytosine/adenosine deaminase-related metal-dependent hydrolase
MLRVFLSSFAFTLGDDTLKYIQDCNIKCGFHIHTSEAIDDNQYNLDKYGLTPVKRLNKLENGE